MDQGISYAKPIDLATWLLQWTTISAPSSLQTERYCIFFNWEFLAWRDEAAKTYESWAMGTAEQWHNTREECTCWKKGAEGIAL